MKIKADLVLKLGLILSVLCSLALANLDPYGVSLDAELHCDDCSSGNILPNGYQLVYFGNAYTSLYVSSNGMISLGKPGSDQLTFDKLPIIAPYLFDLDTQLLNNDEIDGTVFYRTNVASDQTFDTWVYDHFGVHFFSSFSVVVTYDKVKMKGDGSSVLRNTFQAVIHASHYGDTVVCFNYPADGLNWPDSDGNYPTVGFFSGPDLHIAHYLPGSGSADAANLDDKQGNFGNQGEFCYIVSGLELVSSCVTTDLQCRAPSYFPIHTPITAADVLSSYTKCNAEHLELSHAQFACSDVGLLSAVTATIGDDYCTTYFIPTVNVALAWVNCPSDITVYSSTPTTVHWVAPTAIGDCLNAGAESISHRPDDSLFTLGTTFVTYYAYDAQYHSVACTFEVTVEKPVAITYEVVDVLNRPIKDAAIGGFPDCAYTDYHGLCRVEAPQYQVGDFIPAFNYQVTQYGDVYVVPHGAVYVDCYEVRITLIISPPGFYRTAGGDIIACTAGTYSANYEATSCTSCPAGTYQEDEYAVDCDACPLGYTSGEGATACYTCSAGNYLNIATGACESCPAGTYSCDRAVACEPCPYGSWNTAGSETCNYCGAGSYRDEYTHKCLPCPYDTFSADRATECTPCPYGSYSDEGSTHCTYCEPGFYYGPECDHECMVCPAGTFSKARATECTPCPDGSYSSPGASECYYCSAGYYMTSQALETCHHGDCDTCEPCPAGTFSCDRQDHCEPCPPGTWSKIGSDECFSCHAGYYLDDNCGCCDACPEGTYSNDHAEECIPCPFGSWSFGGASECHFCIAGYYFNDNTRSCDLCPAGTFSNPRATECTPCPPGSYSFPGSDVCLFCTAGYFLDDQSQSCLPCPAGYTSCDRATMCNACPYGSTSNPGSSSCNFCDAGYFFDFISETCQACPSGTFSGDRATVCTPCPAGFYSLPGSSFCYSCIAGTYLDIFSGACIPCPEGTISGDRATECIIPPPPEINEEIFCDAGQFFDVTLNACLPCPANTFSGPRALMCTPCPAGSYSPIGSTQCIFCAAGYFLDFNTCSPCPQNTFSLDRAVVCTPCPAGYVSDAASDHCNACPDQTVYQNGYCVACPADSFYLGGVCVPCGYSIPEVCNVCPPGHEPDLICAECPPGFYSPTGHQCLPCPYGQYSGGGFEYCVQCPDGTVWDWAKEMCVDFDTPSCHDRCP